MRDSKHQPYRFDGKTVVVTGAAQGIGAEVAKSIAIEGGQVLLVDRSSIVKDVVREIVELGCEASSFECDLETYEGAKAMTQKAIDTFGQLDILINNVGGTIWTKPFHEYGVDQIEAEIQRSLFPTLWSCRAMMPHFVENQAGVIVNVSSVATLSVNRVPYAAAKGGVNALTASLAFEAARDGVRVVATAPGGTQAPPRRIPRNDEEQSPQDAEWYQEIVDQTTDSTYFGRYGNLREQVGPILFMASDEASYITGSVLPVGGGDQG